MLFVGRQEGYLACKNVEWWGAGSVCLGRDADLHVAQLMPLSLAPVNPDWFYLSSTGSPG